MLNSSGHPTVDLMAEWNPQGLVIPYTWFQTVQLNDKPYMPAIVILAEVVYWYRPKINRDEVSGRVLGYEKRFQADMLQKNRSGFIETFGLTKDQVYKGIKFLEDLGVIQNHLRKIEVNGQTLNNVRFIELNYEILRKLTYPIVSKREGVVSEREGSRLQTREVSSPDETNTEITNTKTTSTDIKKSPKRKKRVYELDSLEMKMSLKLESLIQQNDEKFKAANIQSWCDQFRLMMEKDNRTEQEIHTAMTFAQADNFWQSNILSADKLRKKMPTLLMQAKQQQQRSSGSFNTNAHRTHNYAPTEFSDTW